MIKTLIKFWDILFYDDIKDITELNDLRKNKHTRGIKSKCYYCDELVRIDGPGEDLSISKDEYHCDNCTDIYDDNLQDYRDDTSQRGSIVECFYCGTGIRIDGDKTSANSTFSFK